ncbi:trypsin 5G1-like [Ischnura elegans]|uniref:trypsin 5G1-like n=1 Tax=Ischnura elegans TaxID=197161 RepID=UPI001ED89994|nr:trypsin 5G1-like [Ischnura elegans]
MNATTAVIALAVIASASSFRVPNGRPLLDGRIIGGEDAAPGEFPYQLSLRIGVYHICGASILSEDWAMTAAHCVHDVGRNRLQLMAGSLDVDEGDIYHVTYFTVHPNYDPVTLDWDMAVLKVSKPFVFSCTVSPIALPAEGEELDAGTMVVISGWGDLLDIGSNGRFLQKVTVPVYDRNECFLDYIMYGGITNQMFCAGVKEGGKDSCQGDSGGPLVANDKLYGIVSWAIGCAKRGYPGVYAKVSSMKAFIAKETGLKK